MFERTRYYIIIVLHKIRAYVYVVRNTIYTVWGIFFIVLYQNMYSKFSNTSINVILTYVINDGYFFSKLNNNNNVIYYYYRYYYIMKCII